MSVGNTADGGSAKMILSGQREDDEVAQRTPVERLFVRCGEARAASHDKTGFGSWEDFAIAITVPSAPAR